jgi:hypothetical protein
MSHDHKLCRPTPGPPQHRDHSPCHSHPHLLFPWRMPSIRQIHSLYFLSFTSTVNVRGLSLPLSPKPMSSTPNTTTCSSNFTALFDVALAKYTKSTGRDLRNHPLSDMIDKCESTDAILAIFQEQSRAFNQFRNGNGDPELIKWLEPLVEGLHTISTNAVISAGASLVSPLIAVIYQRTSSNLLSLDIPPCEYHFFCNWYSPISACNSHPLGPWLIIFPSARRLNT